MGYLLRISVAVIGVLLIRGLLYPRGWGRRSIPSALFAVIGLALTLPLASYSRLGLLLTLAGGAVLLFPYRKLAVRYLKARTRAGLRQLAQHWGTALNEDPKSGRWDVVRDEGGSKAWVGNVLTHKGPIDPGVKRKEVGYMLAFVRELSERPSFLCSLMLGWDKPRYFEREWRATSVIHGEFLSLAFGELGLESERGRATGGLANELRPYDDFAGDSATTLAAMSTDPVEFARVFGPELLEELGKVASQTYPYELNVTPTSVNVYTTYCGWDAQKANLDFIDKLVERLETHR
jgi:hypothetical protein